MQGLIFQHYFKLMRAGQAGNEVSFISFPFIHRWLLAAM